MPTHLKRNQLAMAIRWALTFMLVALLAGCLGKNIKPDLPGKATAVKPQIVIVPRKVYVPIPANLTQEERIAEGPLSQCPAVAAGRKAGMKKANAKLRQIGQIQGTAVSEAKP